MTGFLPTWQVRGKVAGTFESICVYDITVTTL